MSQQSSLLPSLFEQVDESASLTVLHIGNALPETVEFFSRYRCKLHFVDLFGELPIVPAEESGKSPGQLFAELLHFPPGTRFDLCLFWDLFNFLDRAAIRGFLATLRPHLHAESAGHGFAVHNPRLAQGGELYGITAADSLKVRRRPAALPGYSPRNRGQLETLLDCFRITRSVLLPDGRLEMVLRATP